MKKEELYKKYQEIMLKTNGGVDDYVVALCQISNLLKDYAEEKDQQIRSLEEQLKNWKKTAEILCNRLTETDFSEQQRKDGHCYDINYFFNLAMAELEGK